MYNPPMRELLILRHAKSSWKHEGLGDHERPLNKRGQRDAPRIGARVRDQGILPDRILASDAVRARQTALLFREGAEADVPLELLRSLYLAPPESYFEVLAELDDAVARPMVVGHNPGMEELVHAITGDDPFVPTGCLIRVTLEIDGWAACRSGARGSLLDLWRPKEIFD